MAKCCKNVERGPHFAAEVDEIESGHPLFQNKQTPAKEKKEKKFWTGLNNPLSLLIFQGLNVHYLGLIQPNIF